MQRIFFWLILLSGLLSILFHFPRLQLDSDSSVVGLMARHILQGRNFPIYFYGFGYVSSLKAFLTVPFFWLFGSSNTILMIVPVILSLIFIVLVYQFGRELYNQEAGLLAMLFAAVAPVSISLWYHTPRGAYIETLVFGTCILILTLRICRGGERKIDCILLGFLSGLGWWTNQLITYYLLTSAFLIFASDKKIFLKRKFPILVLFFLLGSSPAWLWNITHEFRSFGMTRFADLRHVPEYLRRYISVELLYILGLRRRFFPPERYMYFVFGALGMFYLYFFLNWFWRNRKEIANLLLLKFSSSGILVVPFLIISIIYPLSTYAGMKSQRYILPLFSIFPVIIGYGLNLFRKRHRFLYVPAILLIVFTNIHENIRVYRHMERPEIVNSFNIHPMPPLLEFLRSKSIYRSYGSCYGLTPRVSFESNEEVICAEPFQEVVPGYLAEVDAARSPAIITGNWEKDSMEEALKSVSLSFKEKPIGKFAVFYDFSPPHMVYHELDSQKWQAKSNFRSESCWYAFDRNFGTRWTTWENQEPGMYYELDLSEVKRVSKLTFLTRRHDSPRGFSIKVSVDGENWKEVSNVSYSRGSLFWNGPHLFWSTFPQRLDIIFPETQSRFIRITQTSHSKSSWWSIEEFFVFSAEPIKQEPGYELKEVIDFLKEANAKYVYADEWVSARLDKEMGNSIATVHTDRERDWYNELYPKAPLSRLIKFGNDAVLISGEEHQDSLEKSLDRLNINYKEEKTGDYRVYYELDVPLFNGREIGTADWEVFASDNGVDAKNGIDGNPLSRWASGRPQRCGMFYGINLGKAHTVTGIEMELGEWLDDYPRGYEVELSGDGENWHRVETVYVGEYYWSGMNVLSWGHEGNKVRIKLKQPSPSRYIRVKLTRNDKVYYWSIAEIKVFELYG